MLLLHGLEPGSWRKAEHNDQDEDQDDQERHVLHPPDGQSRSMLMDLPSKPCLFSKGAAALVRLRRMDSWLMCVPPFPISFWESIDLSVNAC
ncbi:MAG: hypothetical protein HC871_06330 [Rhizobiales bacterium]|nr:hypothetical protein [Hyphomicrobiales bacterium]